MKLVAIFVAAEALPGLNSQWDPDAKPVIVNASEVAAVVENVPETAS